MTTIAHRLTVPADFGRGGVENMHVGWEAAAGWVGAQFAPVPVVQPEEGQGVVATRGGHPVGISTVGGTTRAVSAGVHAPRRGAVLERRGVHVGLPAARVAVRPRRHPDRRPCAARSRPPAPVWTRRADR